MLCHTQAKSNKHTVWRYISHAVYSMQSHRAVSNWLDLSETYIRQAKRSYFILFVQSRRCHDFIVFISFFCMNIFIIVVYVWERLQLLFSLLIILCDVMFEQSFDHFVRVQRRNTAGLQESKCTVCYLIKLLYVCVCIAHK